MNVHIFIGNFKNRKEAILYTEPFWEPEPGEAVSDEEYSEWEDNNPKWKMKKDLDCYLDEDFIETIGANKFNYLKGILKETQNIKHFENKLSDDEQFLILIFNKAIEPKNAIMKSTERMKYFGKFESVLI